MTRSPFSPGYDRFRKMLVAARRQAGLTQAALSKRLGRPQSFVSKYEHGERRLDVIEFLEVAEAVHITPEAFIAHLRRQLKTRGRQKSV